MTYKEVFQLAQDKGYSELSYPDFEGYKYENNILLELTLIQKWLRDEHKTEVVIFPMQFLPKNYSVEIGNTLTGLQTSHDLKHFNSYEDALLQGISEALKLLQ